MAIDAGLESRSISEAWQTATEKAMTKTNVSHANGRGCSVSAKCGGSSTPLRSARNDTSFGVVEEQGFREVMLKSGSSFPPQPASWLGGADFARMSTLAAMRRRWGTRWWLI